MKTNRFYYHVDKSFCARRQPEVIIAPEPREPLPTEWPLVLSLAFFAGMMAAAIF